MSSTDHALGILLNACAAHGAAGLRGPPASPDQIAALERYWGWRLPPLYRRLLAMHNGISRLWFDVALLPIGTIIDGTPALRAFEATAPAHARWIFACGTESRDALAFDPLHATPDGDLPVVHLGEAGVVARWPSLGAVLQQLLTRLFTGVRGRGTTTSYLWSGLWPYWSGGSSPHSRAFTSGSPVAEYAGRDGLFGHDAEIDAARLLPEPVLAEADRRFAHGVHERGDTEPRLAIVLTEAPAEPSATQSYVYYEPCATLVIALSTVERRASICATSTLWDRWGPSFDALTLAATELLQHGRVADAVLHAIDGSFELFQRMRRSAQPA